MRNKYPTSMYLIIALLVIVGQIAWQIPNDISLEIAASSLLQIQLALLSLSLVVSTFAYNFLYEELDDKTFWPYTLNGKFVLDLVISSTICSVLVYILHQYVQEVEVLTIVLSQMVSIFVGITGFGSVILVGLYINSFLERGALDIQRDAAERLTIRQGWIQHRMIDSNDILRECITNPVENTGSSLSSTDLELTPRDYISDINLKSVSRLHKHGGDIIDGKLYLGYKVPRYDETLVHIGNRNLDVENWKSELQKGIKTEIFDPWFKTNPHSTEFDPINTHIATVEKYCKESIEKRNTATLESELSFYSRLIWNSKIYFNEKSIQPWQKHNSSEEKQYFAISPPIIPVCDSLYRLYQYSIQECEVGQGNDDTPEMIANYIYNRCVALAEDTNGEVHQVSLVNLLRACKKEDQASSSREHLDQCLTDLGKEFD